MRVVLEKTGASCSKITKLLVNDSLKFQIAVLQIPPCKPLMQLNMLRHRLMQQVGGNGER